MGVISLATFIAQSVSMRTCLHHQGNPRGTYNAFCF
jgi:hypothetical protein